MRKLLILAIVATGALVLGDTNKAEAQYVSGGIYYSTPYPAYDYYTPGYYGGYTYDPYYSGAYYYGPGVRYASPGLRINIGGGGGYYGRPYGGYPRYRGYRRW